MKASFSSSSEYVRASRRPTCSPSRAFCSKDFNKSVKEYHLPPIYRLRPRYHLSIRHGKKNNPVRILAPRIRSRLLRLARQGSCDQLRHEPRAQRGRRERAHNGLRWFNSDARGRNPLELYVIELIRIRPWSVKRAAESSMFHVFSQTQQPPFPPSLTSIPQKRREEDTMAHPRTRNFSDFTKSSDKARPCNITSPMSETREGIAEILRPIFVRHNGREVEKMGDAFHSTTLKYTQGGSFHAKSDVAWRISPT